MTFSSEDFVLVNSTLYCSDFEWHHLAAALVMYIYKAGFSNTEDKPDAFVLWLVV